MSVRRLVRYLMLVGLAAWLAGCVSAAGQGVPIPPGTATFEALTGTIMPGGTALPAYAPARPAPTPFGTPYFPSTPQPSFMPALGLRILGVPGPVRWPATDGATAIWQEPETQLWAVRLSDGHAYPPLALPKDAGPFSVSGDLVAGRVADPSPDCPPDCRGHLLIQNFVTGATVPFTDTHHDVVAAALAGDWLVWQAEDPLPGPPRTRTVPSPPDSLVATNYLLARDLKTSAPPVLLRQTTDAMTLAAAGAARVVWAERTDTQPPQTTLYAQSLAGGPPAVVAQGPDISPYYGYDLQGDLLLYETMSPASLVALNLRSGWRKTFPHGAHGSTDGRYIFWVDPTQSAGHVFRRDLFGYDTAGDSSFTLVLNVGPNDYPQARGGYVIWQHAASPYDPVQLYTLDLAEAGWPR